MKIVVLVLSGDAAKALEKLTEEFPSAKIENISRTEFEAGTFAARLNRLRAHGPDVFAIITESLAWQRGRNLFMLFGALAGGREVLMIDTNGNILRRSRTKLIFNAPAKLGVEALTTAASQWSQLAPLRIGPSGIASARSVAPERMSRSSARVAAT